NVGTGEGKASSQCRQLGQLILDSNSRALVIVDAQEPAAFDNFRDQTWLSALQLQVLRNNDPLKSSLAAFSINGSPQSAARALLLTILTPIWLGSSTNSDALRHALYWSLLMAPSAGVRSESGPQPETEKNKPSSLPRWQQGFSSSATKELSLLAKF